MSERAHLRNGAPVAVRREYGPSVHLLESRSDDSRTWAEVERLLARRPRTAPAEVEARFRALEALRDEAEDLLRSACAETAGRAEALVARLREAHPWDELPERERGRLFAAELGSVPDPMNYHLARRGELDLERLRRRFAGPGDVVRAWRRASR